MPRPATWRARSPNADASYDQTWEEAVGQFDGGFEPVVAYMQGNLKVKGATRPLYELFRLWADPAHRSATGSLLPPLAEG